MHERIHEYISYILITTGATTGTIGLNFANIDLGMSILLKLISLASFVCFLLINQDLIHLGWVKFCSRFKKKRYK